MSEIGMVTIGMIEARERAQEEEDDQHDERDRLGDGAVDGLDRAVDEDGVVVGDLGLQAVRAATG